MRIGMALLTVAAATRVCTADVSTAGERHTQASRVTIESRVDAEGNGLAIVTNRADVPLAAYLLEVRLEPCNPTQPASAWRGFDAAATPDGVPLEPAQSREEQLGVSHCNKVGTSTPATAALTAAIFQDGAVSGSKEQVARLLDHRRLIRAECEAILARLRAPDAATATTETLLSDARRRVDAMSAGQRAIEGLADPMTMLEAVLRSESAPPQDRVGRATVMFERWTDALASATRAGRR